MPSSDTTTRLGNAWEEIPWGLTASDIEFLSQLQYKYTNSNSQLLQSPTSDKNHCPMDADINKECTDKLLPKSFDPLLQKKAMLEGELARLDGRGEALKSALELVSKYDEKLNNINALLNPKVQVREGKEELKCSLRLFNEYELIENILMKQTVQHPKYLECLKNCKQYIKVLETKAAWEEAQAYKNKYSALLAPSTAKVDAFILKHFEAASRLELTTHKGDIGRHLEGVCDRNKLLTAQLVPFCQALADCNGMERVEAYVSYRIDTLGPLLSHVRSNHLPLIEILFSEEQAAIEAMCLGRQPLRTLLEWIGNQLYTVLVTNSDKEIFKRTLMVYEGESLPYKTLLELLSK